MASLNLLLLLLLELLLVGKLLRGCRCHRCCRWVLLRPPGPVADNTAAS